MQETETRNQLSSVTMTIDDSSIVLDESSTSDSMTTDQLLIAIEQNTRMTSQGIGHFFALTLFFICFIGVSIIIRRWFFGGV